MEVRSRAAVQEGDEGAVLVGQKPDGLDLTTPYVTQNFLCRSLWGNVTQVDSSAGSRDETRGDRHGGAEPTKALRTVTRETPSWRLRTTEKATCGRNHVLIQLGRKRLLQGAANVVRLVVLLLRLVLTRELSKVLELWRSKRRGRAWLEGATQEQLRRQQRGEVHVEAGSRRLQIGAVLVARVESASVDGHVVGPLRVPVTVTGLVGGKGAVREAVVTSVHLPVEARLETGAARGIGGTLVLLHGKEVRRQTEAVPRVLR